jgi:hypothetical protein
MRGKMGFVWRIEEKPSESYIVSYEGLFSSSSTSNFMYLF